MQFIKNNAAIFIAAAALILSIITALYNYNHSQRLLQQNMYYEIIDAFSELHQKITRCDEEPPSAKVYAVFARARMIEDPELYAMLNEHKAFYEDTYAVACLRPNNQISKDAASKRLQQEFQDKIICKMSENLGAQGAECS
jgi:hypothetical protein